MVGVVEALVQVLVVVLDNRGDDDDDDDDVVVVRDRGEQQKVWVNDDTL